MERNERVFEALVKALTPELFRFAYSLSGNKAVAEDLLQETYARAWKSIDQLRDEKSARYWLYTILRRENARRFERKQAHFVEIDDHHLLVDESQTPELLMDRQRVRDAIMTLDTNYREPLLMQLMGGFSCNEIAQSLQIEPGAVMTRLCRAKKQVVQLLEEKTHGHKMGGLSL